MTQLTALLANTQFLLQFPLQCVCTSVLEYAMSLFCLCQSIRIARKLCRSSGSEHGSGFREENIGYQ